MRREKIQINDDVFDVEVAETEKERAQGLMHRRHLPANRGMLFVMNGGPSSFHMKNTHVPLDILFFDAQNKAVKIDSMAPHIGHSRCSKDVRYVLELPAGTCQRCDIVQGDVMKIKSEEAIKDMVMEVLQESWQNPKRISDIVYRPWSLKFYEQVRQIKSRMHESGEKLNWFEQEMLGTDIGEFALYEGHKVPLDIPIPEGLEEADYQGKDVELNKPKRGGAGSSKFHVYVRDPKTKNVKKVQFGIKGMTVGIDDPDRVKSFVSRHQCKKKNDKTKAGYWSCRLPRYWKSLGLKKTGKQWW